MLAKARIAAAHVCLAAFALLIGVVESPRFEAPSQPAAAKATAAGDCRRCHEPVWREWQASYHSRAWSDDHVQAAFQHFGFDRRCQSCHAPVRQVVMDVTAPIELRADDVACPHCKTPLRLPAGKTTEVKCPNCKQVFTTGGQ